MVCGCASSAEMKYQLVLNSRVGCWSGGQGCLSPGRTTLHEMDMAYCVQTYKTTLSLWSAMSKASR